MKHLAHSLTPSTCLAFTYNESLHVQRMVHFSFTPTYQLVGINSHLYCASSSSSEDHLEQEALTIWCIAWPRQPVSDLHIMSSFYVQRMEHLSFTPTYKLIGINSHLYCACSSSKDQERLSFTPTYRLAGIIFSLSSLSVMDQCRLGGQSQKEGDPQWYGNWSMHGLITHLLVWEQSIDHQRFCWMRPIPRPLASKRLKPHSDKICAIHCDLQLQSG